MTKHYMSWRKSRHSQPEAGCVEVGRSTDGTIGVRDTKQHGCGPILKFTQVEWASFLSGICKVRKTIDGRTSW
jgi:hypothetical protein